MLNLKVVTIDHAFEICMRIGHPHLDQDPIILIIDR